MKSITRNKKIIPFTPCYLAIKLKENRCKSIRVRLRILFLIIYSSFNRNNLKQVYMSNPANELTQLKSRIELYEKELNDITQKMADLLNESTLRSNAEEVAKIYGIAILQYQKLVKAYREYIDSLERNM
jgi:hypothetical protein